MGMLTPGVQPFKWFAGHDARLRLSSSSLRRRYNRRCAQNPGVNQHGFVDKGVL